MLTEQDKRDELFVAILQQMHQDTVAEYYNYGFDDVSASTDFHAVQYYVYLMDNEKQIMLSMGTMVTDTDMTHVLIETCFPFLCMSIFFPQHNTT